MANCHLENLPSEILELIFIQLEIGDLNSLMRTCKLFNGFISQNNQIWKNQLDLDSDLFSIENFQVEFWIEKVKNMKICQKNLFELINGISAECFKMLEMPENQLDLQIALKFGSIEEIIQCLRFILQTNQTENLTVKFYARKILRIFTQQFLLKPKILENNEFEYLKFSILFSQWFNFENPVKISQFNSKINEIEMKIQSQIETSDSHNQILDKINKILYEEVGSCLSDDYYNPANSFVDQILTRKKGIPITLSILYHHFAQKCGIQLKMINFPGHFLLQTNEDIFIDAFDGGKQMTILDLKRQFPITNFDSSVNSVCEPFEVYLRMCRNIHNLSRDADGLDWMSLSSLELSKLLLDICVQKNPTARWRERQDIYLGLCQNYLNKGVNKDKILSLLLELRDADERGLDGMNELNYGHAVDQVNAIYERIEGQREQQLEVTKREEGQIVDFKIGMIMKHKRYDYKCVIYGWDALCKASQGWIVQMGVHRLPQKDKQPFYNVLVEDGSERYAAQENLEPLTEGILDGSGISHPNIGKYFQRLDLEKRYYEPNSELCEIYPDD